MDPVVLMTHLRRELAAFQDQLAGDLSVPVEHCGDWTLHDLADHLGRHNLWAAAAVTDGRGDHKAPPAPRDPEALVAWFEETAGTLLCALDRDPSAPAWTLWPPRTVGFWQRRRCVETALHRWDAEHALGLRPSIDPALAGEGVAEVVDTMAPRQVSLGRAPEPAHAIRLSATDTGASWTYGPGAPAATVSARAENLLLLLWGRLSRGNDAIRWEGDRAAGESVLDGPLTP